ncbi:MAG: flagellar basal body-associated protein FliL [Vicinamibacterales bacterium]
MSETTAAIPAPPKGKKSVLVIGLAAVLVLGGIGGGAFWWTNRAQAAEPASADATQADTEERGIVVFEPFVVNLADAGVSRFLRVKVQLVVANAEQAEKMTKSLVTLSRARSTILELLTTQTSEVLVTADGKIALRKAIGEQVAHSAGDIEIIDVLFSDFVVQF